MLGILQELVDIVQFQCKFSHYRHKLPVWKLFPGSSLTGLSPRASVVITDASGVSDMPLGSGRGGASVARKATADTPFGQSMERSVTGS
jgi:hypothetical protein